MKMIVLILVLGIAGFCIAALTRPDDFLVTRSLVINAPPEKIFLHVNNLRLWKAWSPWDKLDPEVKNTFSGPESGKGASVAWSGNSKVGVGNMSIAKSVPNQRILFDQQFEKPMRAINQAEFVFTPEAGGTRVTWSMFGKNNFIGKSLSLIMNCDKMVGEQFEKGLQSLKQVSEGN